MPFNATVIPATNPYKPNCGDLVCGFDKPDSEQYLETWEHPKSGKSFPFPEGQVLPLCLIDPHPWHAIDKLGIDAGAIRCPYECPYTRYTFHSIVPAALVSTDLEGKWGDIIRKPGVARHSHDYVLDWDYHKSMWKEKVFDLHEVGQAILGLGYTHGTGIWDGSGSKHSTVVNLDNGDKLWVYFWEWHNK